MDPNITISRLHKNNIVINIPTQSNYKRLRTEIFNLAGQKLFSKPLTFGMNELNINYPSGITIVSVYEADRLVAFRKFVL